jgi:hypothetical protein
MAFLWDAMTHGEVSSAIPLLNSRKKFLLYSHQVLIVSM